MKATGEKVVVETVTITLTLDEVEARMLYALADLPSHHKQHADVQVFLAALTDVAQKGLRDLGKHIDHYGSDVFTKFVTATSESTANVRVPVAAAANPPF